MSAIMLKLAFRGSSSRHLTRSKGCFLGHLLMIISAFTSRTMAYVREQYQLLMNGFEVSLPTLNLFVSAIFARSQRPPEIPSTI